MTMGAGGAVEGRGRENCVDMGNPPPPPAELKWSTEEDAEDELEGGTTTSIWRGEGASRLFSVEAFWRRLSPPTLEAAEAPPELEEYRHR